MFNRSTFESDEGHLPSDRQLAFLEEQDTPTPETLKRLRSQVMSNTPKPKKGAGQYMKGSSAQPKGKPKEPALPQRAEGKSQTAKTAQQQKAPSQPRTQPQPQTQSRTAARTPRPSGTASSRAFMGSSQTQGATMRHSTSLGKPGTASHAATLTRQPVFSQATAQVNSRITRRQVSSSMPVHSAFLDQLHDDSQGKGMKGLRLSWVAGKSKQTPAQRVLRHMQRMRLPARGQGGKTLGNPIHLQQNAAAMASARSDLVGRMAGKAIGSLLKKLYDKEETDELDEETAVSGLGLILRLGGDFTYEHSTRVLDLALELADEVGVRDQQTRREIQNGVVLRDIGEFDLLLQGQPDSEEKIKELGDFLGGQEMLKAGLLHDIGKVQIPPEILYKPGKLTPEEYDIIKMHPIYGEEIVRPIASLRYLCPTIRGHHERWDGKGYPDGLAGEEIPLAARIIAVADVFDALAADRPYKRGMEVGKVEQILEQGRGTHFDPSLVDAFLDVIERRYPVDDEQEGAE